MKKVHYLCRGSAVSDDLFFAQELPEDYFAPGLFLIEASDARGKIDNVYGFAARQSSQQIDLELKSLESGRAYVVDAGVNGKFYFKVIAMSRGTQYSGKLIKNFERFPFFRLEPANMQQLEQACVRNDFYFIGSSGD